jgi:hypothetical protein
MVSLHAASAGNTIDWMAISKGSSIRVPSVTRRPVRSHAVDSLERAAFWAGFDSEAEDYLRRYPGELAERDTFGKVSADGMRSSDQR